MKAPSELLPAGSHRCHHHRMFLHPGVTSSFLAPWQAHGSPTALLQVAVRPCPGYAGTIKSRPGPGRCERLLQLMPSPAPRHPTVANARCFMLRPDLARCSLLIDVKAGGRPGSGAPLSVARPHYFLPMLRPVCLARPDRARLPVRVLPAQFDREADQAFDPTANCLPCAAAAMKSPLTLSLSHTLQSPDRGRLTRP